MKILRSLRPLWLRATWLLLPLAVLPRLHADEGPGSNWTEVSHSGSLTVYNRERAGSPIKEIKGVGTINAPNWVVKNVIDDADHYASFMPYVEESRVLSRDAAKHTTISYAKINPPLISRRDYTLLVHDESKKNANGTVTYKNRWESANEKGPPEQPGIVRVKVTDGYWLLEPADNGQATHATYLLYTDGGGGIPTFLANEVNKTRVKNIFDAIGKQAQKAEYRQTKPAFP
jgi:hypothetical protein